MCVNEHACVRCIWYGVVCVVSGMWEYKHGVKCGRKEHSMGFHLVYGMPVVCACIHACVCMCLWGEGGGGNDWQGTCPFS